MRETIFNLPLAAILPRLAADIHAAFEDDLPFFAVCTSDETLFVSDLLEPVWDEDLAKEFCRLSLRENMAAHAFRMPFHDLAGIEEAPDDQSVTKNPVLIVVLNESDINTVTWRKGPRPEDDFPMTALHVFKFYHEMGHILVPEGWAEESTEHVRECAADAYGMLRYLQAGGTANDAVIRCIMTEQRGNIFTTSGDHDYSRYFTLGALQHIEDISRQKDLSALTAAETVALAGQAARDYSFSDERLASLQKIFEPARKARAGDDTLLELFISADQAQQAHPDDHDVLRIAYGIWTENPVLMEKVYASHLGDDWREIFNRMQARFDAEDIPKRFSNARDITRRG